MTLPEWKIPWHPIDTEHGEGLARELAREVGPRHVLYGQKVRAVAVRQDCDDVLFAIEGAAAACAVVHLTWHARTDADPMGPWTVVFPTIEEWRRSVMIPDHEDFTS